MTTLVLHHPNARLAGIFANVTAWGTLRITNEPGTTFVDTFDGSTLDTTNRWNVASDGGGGYSVSNGAITLTTGTTASAWSVIQSIPAIPTHVSMNCLDVIHQFEAVSIANTYQFGGVGTYPATPTITAPLTDAIGFEKTSAGVLNAVIYQAGTKIFSQSITIPTDGNYHRYLLCYREDFVAWYVDSFEVPLATANFLFPSTMTLPILEMLVNGTTAPSTAPTFKTSALGMADSGCNSSAISDSTYPWRQSTIKPASTPAATTDPALVVALSPNSAGTANSGSIAGNGNIIALPNGTTILTLAPYVGITLEISGTWSGVLTLYGSNGGSYYAIDVVSLANPNAGPQGTITANGLYYAPLSCVSIELVMSSYVSGTVSAYCSLHSWPSSLIPVNPTKTVRPLYGASGQAITIALANLVAGNSRASTVINNTSSLFEDILFFVQTTLAASGVSAVGYINVYGYGSVDNGTTYPEGITGTDAGVTLSAPPVLALLAQLTANTNGKVVQGGPFSFCRQAGFDRLPALWGVVVQNQSGATLSPTGAGHFIKYQGVNGQLQ
jgi:hypothetical protein